MSSLLVTLSLTARLSAARSSEVGREMAVLVVGMIDPVLHSNTMNVNSESFREKANLVSWKNNSGDQL